MQGRTFGPYKVIEQLGSGGMGVVYRAEDTRLGRHVALKFLPDQRTDEDALERFRREARTASSLNHPHICTIHDIGTEDSRSFIVMELLEGVTLRQRLAGGAIPWQESVEYGRQIADALDAAHERGIIHRDLKPANIFVTSRSQVKILDFGLAKLLSSEPVAAGSAVETAFQTTSGTTLGTVAYMSPEQARGEEVDRRSDIFSFGVVLYEMLTGRVPFGGPTHALIFDAILHKPPDSTRTIDPGIPEDLDRIVLKALEKDRRYRYQTAADLLADLTRLKRDSDSGISVAKPAVVRSRNAFKWVVVPALVVATAIGVLVMLRTSPSAPTIPAASREIKETQITANPVGREVSNAYVSRDGRMVAFSDPRGIALYLRETGETRVVADTAGMMIAGWLGESRMLATRQGADGAREWWAVSLLGGKQRTELSMQAPDGRTSAGLDPEFRQLWAASSPGATRKVVFDGKPTNEYIVGFGFLHNGQLMTLLRADTQGALVLETVQPTSGHREVIMEFDQRRPAMGGTGVESSGRVLYAQLDTPGQPGMSLWSVEVDASTGRRASDPVRLKSWSDVTAYGLSASLDGKVLAMVRNDDQGDVAIAELSSRSTASAPPRRLSLDDRNDFPTGWADNSTVIFVSDRLGSTDIFRQSIESESAELVVGGEGRQTGPRPTPDRTAILFIMPIDEGGVAVRRVPITGGVAEDVVRSKGYEFHHCGDTRCILVEREGDAQIVYELDPVKGRGSKLAELHWTDQDPVLSPDGRRIAYRSYSNPVDRVASLKIMTLDGGAVETVNLPGLAALSSLDWAPDGQGFYIVNARRADSSGAGTTLYYVPLRGKPVEIYGAADAAPQWAVPSPDGKRLAVHTRTHKRNVWTLEGF